MIATSSESLATSIDEVCWSGDGFGLAVLSDSPLLVPAHEPRCGEILELHRRQPEDPASPTQPGDGQVLWNTRFPDGSHVQVTEGAGGEHWIAYGEHALFVLSPDRNRVDWSSSSDKEAAVQRFLLDTVLWWTALARGSDLLHASAVELPDGVVAVLGRSGVGKTSVAIELLAGGGSLYADDVLSIRRLDAELVTYPGPSLMNVPRALLGLISEHGRAIASFSDQDETWMSVEPASDGPKQLRALFLLERAGTGEPRSERLDPSPFALMTHAWGLESAGPRAQQSFESYAELSQAIPTYNLRAGSEASPAMIAAEIMRCSGERSD
jgi:hypothetical protein